MRANPSLVGPITNCNVEWRMEIRSDHSCIQGVRFNNVAFHSINLASPRSGRVTLLGSTFEYTAKRDFQGDNSFAVSVSGAIDPHCGFGCYCAPETKFSDARSQSHSCGNGFIRSGLRPRAAKSDHRMLQMNRNKFEDWSSRWRKVWLPNNRAAIALAH